MAKVALQYSLYGKGVGFPSSTQPTEICDRTYGKYMNFRWTDFVLLIVPSIATALLLFLANLGIENIRTKRDQKRTAQVIATVIENQIDYLCGVKHIFRQDMYAKSGFDLLQSALSTKELKELVLGKGGLLPEKTAQSLIEYLKLSEEYILQIEGLKQTYAKYREAKKESDGLQMTLEFMEGKYSKLVDSKMTAVILKGLRTGELVSEKVLKKPSRAKMLKSKRIEIESQVREKIQELEGDCKKAYLNLVKYIDSDFKVSSSPLFLIYGDYEV